MRLALFLTLFLPLSVAVAQGYYDNKAEGWFWYVDPIEEVEPEPVKPEPPKVVVAPEESPQEKPEPQAADTKVQLNTTWLRDNMNNYLMRAIDNPTKENVAVFLYMQRLMVDRSAEFTRSAQEVYATSPWLTNAARNPEAQGAKVLMTKAASKRRQSLMREIGSKTTLYYIVDSACIECRFQRSALYSLTARDFNLVVASVDDEAPEGIEQDEVVSLEALPTKVRNYPYRRAPALIAVHEDGPPTHISAAVLSASDLEKNLLLIAKHHGWITPRQYASTKPTREVKLAISSQTEVDQELMDKPDQFLNFLQKQIEIESNK